MASNRTARFLFITFLINFSMVGLFVAFGGRLDSTAGFVLATVYMFIPTLSVLIVEKLIHKEKIKKPLGISFRINRWFFVAWLVPPLVAGTAFGISLLFPGVSYSPEMEGILQKYAGQLTPEQLEQMRSAAETMPVHPFWITLLEGLVAGLTINAVAGFGEELGWRGFLPRRLQHMSFFKVSLLIGFIWGVWHSPLILLGHNYPQHPQFGVLMMTIWCMLLTPLFLYVRLKSGSVIAAAIMHGTLNGTAGAAIILVRGGSDLSIGVTGLAGFIALAIFIGLFFIYDSQIAKEKIMRGTIGGALDSQESSP